MPGWIGRPRGGRPLGLVGMIGLVVAVEIWLAAHAVVMSDDPVALRWGAIGRTAGGDEVKRSEVLCFGDSLVAHGVYPRIFETWLGRPTYNLALPGGPSPASYFLLRRALDAGARPKVLVVDFHAYLLLIRPEMTAGYYPELLTTRELVELSLSARDLRFFTRVATAMVLPSVKTRRAIRSRLMAALQDQPWPGAGLNPILLHNLRVNRGVLVAPALAAHDGPPANHTPTPESSWWEVDRTASAYVGKFLDLAAERGIPVIWLMPPTSSAYLAQAERNGRDARYAAFVRATQARYPNVVVVDGRRSGYPDHAFVDAAHLNRPGAVAFSESVAALIGSRPADRWVKLPDYQERREVVPLEDVVQSATALRESADRRLR